ncbi:MAG: SPFH domain-containing protein, partial [Lachnospiraceae bacterium]|nr:SPFH domain-containing protein [Lachnospiraceae bacterium]
MRKLLKRAVLILVLACMLAGGTGAMVVTQENEYKLIRQFGRIERVIDHAGLSFKVPFLQTLDTLPKEILIYDLAPSDVITKDNKTMLCDSYALWRITDPLKFAQTLNGSVANAERRID